MHFGRVLTRMNTTIHGFRGLLIMSWKSIPHDDRSHTTHTDQPHKRWKCAEQISANRHWVLDRNYCTRKFRWLCKLNSFDTSVLFLLAPAEEIQQFVHSLFPRFIISDVVKGPACFTREIVSSDEVNSKVVQSPYGNFRFGVTWKLLFNWWSDYLVGMDAFHDELSSFNTWSLLVRNCWKSQ